MIVCRVFLGSFACLFVGIGSLAAQGAAGPGQRWGPFDPDKFFEQMFGKETPEQLRALESVHISPKEEARIGQDALERFLQMLRGRSIAISSKGEDIAYLQSLVQQLHPLTRNAKRYRRIRVLIAESSESDARSFPGGTIVVFRGLLKYVDSEAMLVAVLGHELSHLDHGHQLRHLQALRLAQSQFAERNPGKSMQQMFNQNMLLARLFARPFRPEDEASADSDGVAWAYELGYDPRQFAELFRKMEQRDREKPAGFPAVIPAFFRSHPYHKDRYEAVTKQASSLLKTRRKRVVYVGRENLKKRIPMKKQRFPE